MDKPAIRSIVEATLKSGTRSPGMFEIPKALALKGRLEECKSGEEVITVILDNISTIRNMFEVKTSEVDKCIASIRALA